MVFLPGMLAVVLAVLLAAPLAHADVQVTASAYGKSVIIEIASEPEDISRLQIWFAGGAVDSFRVENGWAGKEMPDGSVLFTADVPASGATTTFAITADSPPREVRWQAGGSGGPVGSGAITLIDDPEPGPDPVFRIVPDSPHIGSTIRVVGQSLPPSVALDFYINGDITGTFTTSDAGYFAGTARIPQSLSPGDAEFRLGSGDDALAFGIRLDHPRETAKPAAGLELGKVPDTVRRGDSVGLQGTGDPGTRIIIEVRGPDGELVNSLVAGTDARGAWSADPVMIRSDSPLGLYTVTVTDGRHSAEGSWSVGSGRVMDISPLKKILDPGDVIAFEGTALPNEQINLVIENPDGDKVGARAFTTDDSGRVEFEYRTSADSALGPYTLIAVQGGQTEFVHTYLGKEAAFDFNLELDKTAYMRGETVVVYLSGKGSDTLNLTILGEKGATRKVEYASQVVLDSEGRGQHSVFLGHNYTEGTYTARLGKGNIADEEHFGVDLDIKSPNLSASPVKEAYARGEGIVIIGSTYELMDNPNRPPDKIRVCTQDTRNIQIILRMVDPEGGVVKAKSAFTDNNCSVIDRTFVVPDDAALGTWKIVSSVNLDAVSQRPSVDAPANRTADRTPTAAEREVYDGCVPATDLGKLVLLACRKDVDGPDPIPVLRLVDKAGTVVWEGETALVDDIFNVLNETRGDIQGLGPVAAKRTASFDHDCNDPVGDSKAPGRSNQTKIDLLGVETVVCSHGQRYNAPVPVCSGPPGTDPIPRHNASAIDRFRLGEQTILFTCGSRTNGTDSATRTVTVLDRENPRIFLSGRTVDRMFKYEPFVEAGASCSDTVDGTPLFFNDSASLDRTKLGEHKVTYTCIDDAGNTATRSRTITVLDPCDLRSYENVRGETGRNILGCGGAGSSLAESPFEVVDTQDDTLRIRTEDGGKVGAGNLVNVIVTGSNMGTTISISYEGDRQVHEYVIQDPGSEVTYHWLADWRIEPGTYRITAEYGDQRAETEYYIPLR